MSFARRILGQAAESEAEQYLRRKGYRILERNIRSSLGEIDFVAQTGRVLVFVEVKARRTSAFGGAAYAVDSRKQAKLVRLAAQYLARRKLHDRLCRFDVVLWSQEMGRFGSLEHIENAFEVSGDDLRY